MWSHQAVRYVRDDGDAQSPRSMNQLKWTIEISIINLIFTNKLSRQSGNTEFIYEGMRNTKLVLLKLKLKLNSI